MWLCTDVFGVPLGTYLMRNREPFKIRSFVALHNAILFLLSLYMSVTTVKQVSRMYPSPQDSVFLSTRMNVWCVAGKTIE